VPVAVDAVGRRFALLSARGEADIRARTGGLRRAVPRPVPPGPDSRKKPRRDGASENGETRIRTGSYSRRIRTPASPPSPLSPPTHALDVLDDASGTTRVLRTEFGSWRGSIRPLRSTDCSGPEGQDRGRLRLSSLAGASTIGPGHLLFARKARAWGKLDTIRRRALMARRRAGSGRPPWWRAVPPRGRRRRAA
jgi:hypothetical protein